MVKFVFGIALIIINSVLCIIYEFNGEYEKATFHLVVVVLLYLIAHDVGWTKED